MQQSFTYKQLNRRADQILRGVRMGAVPPNSDALAELAELTAVLDDQPVKLVVVARMTVQRALGARTIVEIYEDATFNKFYHVYDQDGARRSTKRLVRNGNRNDGIASWMPAHRMTPGLELLAARWINHPGVVSVKIRIIKRRSYKRLINACPNELGLTQVRRQHRVLSPARS